MGHNYLTSYLTLWQPRQCHGARKPSTQRPKQQSYFIPGCLTHQPDRQTLIYFHKFTPQQRTLLKGPLLWNELLLIDADLCSVTITTKTFQFDTQYYRYGPRAESDPKLPSPNSQLVQKVIFSVFQI